MCQLLQRHRRQLRLRLRHPPCPRQRRNKMVQSTVRKMAINMRMCARSAMLVANWCAVTVARALSTLLVLAWTQSRRETGCAASALVMTVPPARVACMAMLRWLPLAAVWTPKPNGMIFPWGGSPCFPRISGKSSRPVHPRPRPGSSCFGRYVPSHALPGARAGN